MTKIVNFASILEDGTRQQAERTASMPFVYPHLALMPDASGIALGFDRLAMLACGANRIDDVLWTPVAETLP